MTPKEKAQELVDKYWFLNYGWDGVTKDEWAKEGALIAVDEILDATKVKWATQRKLPNGEWKFWKGVSYKNYWVKVKTEIEKL